MPFVLNRKTNSDPSAFRSLDWFTVILYLLLVLAGVVSIYAASYDFDHASILSFDEFSGKQLRWIGLGLVLGLIILISDYRIYETYAYPFYVVMMVVLAVTAVIAPDIKGSHSWLRLGPVSLQPAEFAKCATALALAKLFNSYNFKLNNLKSYAKAVGIILLPIALIILESETGSALVYLSLFFVLYREGMSGMVLLGALAAVVIFVVSVKYPDPMLAAGMLKGDFIVMVLIMITSTLMAGLYARSLEVMRNVGLAFLGLVGLTFLLGGMGVELPWKWIYVGAIALVALYFVFMAIKDHLKKLYVCAIFALGALVFSFSVNMLFEHLAPHQQNRILVSLGIKADPRGAGYNVNQSMIAIGSGGITGKGFLNGTQTKLKYVPEQHTDFIFCTIGEEQGFLGTSAVVLLFLMLILRIITIAERQPSTFVRVYAYCVASILIFHFCINLGMVIGLCPVIGIPLPFFSYGGSSLWGFTLLMAILLRLDSARKQFRT
ncbi:MAG: rod shape-determining protein RodA [Bacteroides sp.]|nr:rod shape-determining protein RodA [Bacteroides sp.]MCM1379075.1 rod shape-determining protein RodA [Bacteroides sp.]MCM1445773.1 rod shape-determining protein RodA [Prevotella sp.]